MALVMQRYQIEGRDYYRPLLTCDHCQQRIEAARDGNVEWQVDQKGAPLAGGALFFTHRACFQAFVAAQESHGRWCREELSAFMMFLGNWLTVDWAEAQRIAGQAAGS